MDSCLFKPNLMFMRQLFIASLLICNGILASHAQGTNAKEAALQKLKQLVNTYRQSGGLSFDALYRYAPEATPNQYLDSLQGQFKLKGNNFWYKLANMESVCNEQYLIVLFKEDDLLYLTRPTPAHAGAMNPFAALDSFMQHGKHISFELQEDNAEYRVMLNVQLPSSNAGSTYHIDKKTGFLTKMTSKVPAEQLYDPSVRAMVQNGQSTYAIVEVRFSNYEVGGVSDQLFDHTKYFIKQGDEFKTIPPYEMYKVFKGSTNL